MLTKVRALHYALVVTDLKKNIEFFRDTLSMKVLRHEVSFQRLRQAGNISLLVRYYKTLIGYGPEDDHFVLELTYKEPSGPYIKSNDLQYIKISLKQQEMFDKILASQQNVTDTNSISLESPDGCKIQITKDETAIRNDISEVCLACSGLTKSTDYWTNLLKMREIGQDPSKKEVLLQCSPGQVSLRLRQLDEPVSHKCVYGRIAFSCPSEDLKLIQAASEAADQKVLTPHSSLETAGKATTQMVTLADPDKHEICFVDDEGFRQLSQVNPEANNLIEESLRGLDFIEWFHKECCPNIPLSAEGHTII